MNETPKVGIYVRVSSEDQAERGTIENQIEFGTKYCDLHQLPIVDWYKDDGVTGTIPLEDRTDGKRLLDDVRSGKINFVLIWKIDRFGRSTRAILNGVHELEKYGAKIKSMTESFDTSDAAGRLLLTVLAGVADHERTTIIDRLWHGANRAARAGKWLGGIVPYGYLVEEKYLIVNDTPIPGFEQSEADVVRLIYHLLVDEGLSCVKIANYLNAVGFPTSYRSNDREVTKGKRKERTAGVWTPSHIGRMIASSTYKGVHLYGKRTQKLREIIPRVVPAIIPEDFWERAQEVLHENRLEKLWHAKHEYLLSGLIKCGSCGTTYIGTRMNRNSSAGGYLAYYKCGGKQTYRGKFLGKCKSKNIPKDWIENLIWNDCERFITQPGDTIRNLKANFNKTKANAKNIESEKELLTRSIYDKEVEKQAILDLFRRRIITGEDVEKQLQKISEETESIRDRLKELDVRMDGDRAMVNQFDSIETWLESLREMLKNPTFENRRIIIKSLVKGIVINTTSDDRGKPQASISATYYFSTLPVSVLRTDKNSLNDSQLTLCRTMTPPARWSP